MLNLRQDLDPTASWLQTIRDRATAIVQELAIPSTRDEDWRFTDLAGLLKVNFQAIDQNYQRSKLHGYSAVSVT